MEATQEKPIVNKIKQAKKLVTINLQDFYDDTPIAALDLKEFLFKGLILKEDDFRKSLEEHNWKQYKGKYLRVFCSTDAIISKWAYMLVAQHAVSFTKDIFEGEESALIHELYRRQLAEVNWADYKDKFIILKGCSDDDKPVPGSVYLYATKKLVPHVKKIMYGEACSNVPVYRQPRK